MGGRTRLHYLNFQSGKGLGIKTSFFLFLYNTSCSLIHRPKINLCKVKAKNAFPYAAELND